MTEGFAKYGLMFCLLLVIGMLAVPVMGADEEKFPAYAPDRILVKFSGTPSGYGPGEEVLKEYSLVPGLQLIQLPNGTSVEDALPRYRTLSSVEYAEPDYYYTMQQFEPADPFFDLLWGMHNTGQDVKDSTWETTDGSAAGTDGDIPGGVAGADVKALSAWEYTTGSPDIIVAVADTGVMYTHSDLEANIWTNTGEIRDNDIDDDGNGYIDDYYGWNFGDNTSNPMGYQEHGTHCAGTIAAVANDIGVTGIAPGVKIMPLRVVNIEGIFTAGSSLEMVEYAQNMGARVVSCSYGGPGFSQSMFNAISNSTLLFVCAAGNAASDNDKTPTYPAGYDCPNLISIAATTPNDTLASFSNYGAVSVDVAAPGTNIVSTIPIYDNVTLSTENLDQYGNLTEDGDPWYIGEATLTSGAEISCLVANGSADTMLYTKEPVGFGGKLGLLRVGEHIRMELAGNASVNFYLSSVPFSAYPNITDMKQADTSYEFFDMTAEDLVNVSGTWAPSSFDIVINQTMQEQLGNTSLYLGFCYSSDNESNKVILARNPPVILDPDNPHDGWASYQGTSMATPLVSGIAALVYSVHPNLTAPEVRAILMDTIDPLDTLSGKVSTGGRVNATAAIMRVKEMELTPAFVTITAPEPGTLYNLSDTGTAHATVYSLFNQSMPNETVLWTSSSAAVTIDSTTGDFTVTADGGALLTATAANNTSAFSSVYISIPAKPGFNTTANTTAPANITAAEEGQLNTTITVQGTGNATTSVTITSVPKEELPAGPPDEPIVLALNITTDNLLVPENGSYTFTFTLPAAAVQGKTVTITHYNGETWEECRYDVNTSGDPYVYTVYTPSFSPFVVTLMAPSYSHDSGPDDGAELLAAARASMTTTETPVPATPVITPAETPVPAATLPAAPYVPETLIVQFGSTVTPGEMEAAAAAIGATIEKALAPTLTPNLMLVNLPASVTVEEAVTYFEGLPVVEYAEPDYLMTIAAPTETPLQTAVPTATEAAVPMAGILAGIAAAALLRRK